MERCTEGWAKHTRDNALEAKGRKGSVSEIKREGRGEGKKDK